MRKLASGAAMAALLCGAAVMSPAKAVETPKHVEQAGRNVHQFVFDRGNAAYHGPLDERLGINGAVAQAPRLGAPAAYVTAVEQSLRRLGAPDRVAKSGSHEGPNYFVEKGGDWDGDGIADALGIESSNTGLNVAALDGKTGAELWRWTESSGYGYAQAAVVGDGKQGVVVWTYSGVSAVATAVPTLTVTALDSAGGVVWEKVHRGSWVWVGAAVVARNVPLLTGIGGLTASSADDVLVSTATYAASAVGTSRTSVEVLDGVAGAPAFKANSSWNGELLESMIGPDLTGDGRDDVLLVGSSLLAAVRGTDGAKLWEADGLPLYYRAPQFVGDVTGDGRTDLAVSSVLWDSEDYYARETAVLDGATGARTAVVPGTLATGAGDVNGDGKGDLSTVSVGYESSTATASVTYQTFTGTGTGLGSQTYSQTDDWDTSTYVYVWQVADVQHDGSSEWAHNINVYDEDGLRRSDRGVVSGRTNLRMWEGKVGVPVGGAIDGEGEDLVQIGPGGVKAQDGVSGRTLWTAALPRYEADDAWSVGDLDGDGRDEVAVLLIGDSTNWSYQARVLSGADGTPLWNDLVVVVNPPSAIPAP